MKHLDEEPFTDSNYYTISVDDDEGVTVFSECCADTMSRETVEKVYAALGKYLAKE